MKTFTKILITAWTLEVAGMIYALAIPVGQASAWVLLPTALLGLPLLAHFAVVAFRPLPAVTGQQRHRVMIDGVEYIPDIKSPRT